MIKYFENKPARDVLVLVLFFEFDNLLCELWFCFNFLQLGNVAERVEHNFNYVVDEWDTNNEQNGGEEMISSCVIILQIL